MTRILFFTIILFFTACSNTKFLKVKPVKTKTNISKIAFGSCSKEDKAQPILESVLTKNPELFIYLGDNIYGDTRDMNILKAKYDRLNAKEEFQNLRNKCMVLAIWDDHDYGENDAGRHYPMKAESKEIFLDFWKEPKNSIRRKHEGIYHSLTFGKNEQLVQIILLDTRTFRDNLVLTEDNPEWKNDYKPNTNPDSTFLGEQQWKWIEEQLKTPAKVRIIASSNQFSHEYNGYESWTNVPHEQQKMLELIKKTKANGVVFISGDVHWGELSKMKNEGAYPIYDITSSGITEVWESVEPNKNRLGDVVRENNFGMINIDWTLPDPLLTFHIYDINGSSRVEYQIKLSGLTFQ
jgi:alkaline phosphatase D